MKRRLIALASALLLVLTAGCSAAEKADPPAEEIPAAAVADYPGLLFDTSRVHTIDIRMPQEAWDGFIAVCENQEYIACDLVIDGELFENAALRAKGNSSLQRSRATGKYSFKVEFDHFGDGSFHGLDKLALNNLVVDDACQRDYITYAMMARFGVPSPLCSYAFVTVNGEDFGFYLAVEGVEDAFALRNYGPEPGAIYKPDNLSRGGGMPGAGGSGSEDVKLKYVGDEPEDYPNIFGSAKTDVSRKDQYRLIESLRRLNEGEDVASAVDVEKVLRYLVVHTFVCNGDSYTGSSVHNYYLHEKDGLLSMIPWDYNEAFGSFGASGMGSVVNAPIDTPVTSGEMDERPMVAWIFADETYTARYHALYAAFLDEIADSGWLAAEIRRVSELIAPYVERDPRSFCTVDAFRSGTDALLTYFELRTQSVAGQLSGLIPATTAGQAADSSALVDTSALPSGSREAGGGMRAPSREASAESSDGSATETGGESSDEAAA